MNLGIIVAIAIVVVSVVISNHPVDEPEVSPSPAPLTSPSPSPSSKPPSPQPSPSALPSPSPSPAPSSSPSGGGNNLETFRYPGSLIQSQSQSSLSLESSDAAQTVTQWYQDTIKSLGYSTTAFVRVSTNDNVNNELAASGFGRNIRVIIRQQNPSSSTTITVTEE